jgi:hypothetical protein
MITAILCRAAAAQCVLMGQEAEISTRRATILMATSRSRNALANQTDLYEIIKTEEDG